VSNNRDPRNNNRLELYKRLLPKIIEQDQASGAQGFIMHWDDPDAVWDDSDINNVWDIIGVSPVIQELFHVIEKSSGEDLEALESLDALIDPLRCPESLLPQIAASFGYRLDESRTEDTKRAALIGLINAFKSRGQFAGFRVFYRLLGFSIIDVLPLWKKEVHEANDDYSRLRYDTSPVAETVGPAALSAYSGMLQGPIRPTSVRFTDGVFVIRDDVVVAPENVNDRRGRGDLLHPSGVVGSINYTTGEYSILLPAPAAGSLDATYERIDEEWPFHAARIDMELSLSPGGGPIPVVDGATVDGILQRLEEVRPVHVLLRALALVAELTDDFGPEGATDRVVCATVRKFFLSGQAGPPAILGLSGNWFLDQGPRGDDLLIIDQLDPIGTDITTLVMEDAGVGACVNDVLIIEEIPGNTYYV
jgi:hypothetical protein